VTPSNPDDGTCGAVEVRLELALTPFDADRIMAILRRMLVPQAPPAESDAAASSADQ
jgi:hypothetical protein